MKHTEETKRKISESKKGKPTWNKGMKGYRAGIPKPWKKKEDEDSPTWKGDNVGYRGIHKWVEKHLGKPSFCQNCGNSSKPHRSYQWANINHTYKRVLSDWRRLCVKCHKLLDKK